MHNIAPYPRRIQLVATWGAPQSFTSPAEALAQLGPRRVRSLIGHGVTPPDDPWSPHSVFGYPTGGSPRYSEALMGIDGEILTEADFPGLPARKTFGSHQGSYMFKHYGRKRKSRGVHKRVHTTPERRLHSLVLPEEGEPPVRASRRPGTLPNTWDDYLRHDYRNNNWKRYRRTQYKAGVVPGYPPKRWAMYDAMVLDEDEHGM